MARLANLISAASPGSGIQFRRKRYGNSGIRQFLRDVIALANAAVDGPRYIIVGVDIDGNGNKRLASVSRDDFSGKPAYQGVVSDFVEPPIGLTYESVSVDGKRLGVFEIEDCQDRPYMMRLDYSEKLRRGDAYIRIDDAAVKIGRQQLQHMFESKFRDSVPADQVEIGFSGEIIYKSLKIPTTDLAQLPSAVAREKLEKLLEIQANSRNTGTTTGLIRLAHTRFFGCDNPYETWTPEKLMAELSNVETKHRLDDLHFLFQTEAQELQLVVFNHGDKPIDDACLSILMPRHDALRVAERLPKLLRDGQYVDRRVDECAAYPDVTMKDDVVHVSTALAEIPVGLPVNAFGLPLRVCAGTELRGRRLAIEYSLVGRNLRTPAKGKLQLLL